ncbi:MAG TPA: helix-hairpin-helix domain-containing protein [Longimicrobium sp.]
MATTRGKGGKAAGGTGTPARTRTRAPEDEISGVAAPEAAAPPAKRARRAAPASAAAEAGPPKRGNKRETYVETAARRRREKEVDQLAADLRAFAMARPSGWDHDDWVSFLAHLGEQGHDVSDADGIGRRLERERLGVVLGGVQGLGPKRVDGLVERFETLWSLRHASAAEVASVPGMTRPLAERLVEDLRTRFP